MIQVDEIAEVFLQITCFYNLHYVLIICKNNHPCINFVHLSLFVYIYFVERIKKHKVTKVVLKNFKIFLARLIRVFDEFQSEIFTIQIAYIQIIR